MSSSADDTTLLLQLGINFFPNQLLAIEKDADGRNNSWKARAGSLVGLWNSGLSTDKQKAVKECAEKFSRIRWCDSITFTTDRPPAPEGMVQGVVHFFVSDKRELCYVLRAPWGETVTGTLDIPPVIPLTPEFLHQKRQAIYTLLGNRGLILERNSELADVYARSVLDNLIAQCREKLETVTGSTGLGQTGKDLDRLPAFLARVTRKFGEARLLNVWIPRGDAFTIFRYQAGVYLFDKVWGMEKEPSATTLPKSIDPYREAGVQKGEMLIEELYKLQAKLDALQADDKAARDDAVCDAIEQVMMRNFIICLNNGVNVKMPFSVAVKLPFELSVGTSSMAPSTGELEVVFEEAYMRLNSERATRFLQQYMRKPNEGTAATPSASQQSQRFFVSSAPSGHQAYPSGQYQPTPPGPLRYQAYPDYHGGYPDSSRHPAYPARSEHQGYPGYPDHGRSSTYPSHPEYSRPPVYPVYPDQALHSSHASPPPPVPFDYSAYMPPTSSPASSSQPVGTPPPSVYTPPPAPAASPAPVFMPPPPPAAPSPAPIRMPLPPSPPPAQTPDPTLAETAAFESEGAIPMP